MIWGYKMPDPKIVQIGKPFTEFPGESFNALVLRYYADTAKKIRSPTPGDGSRPFLTALVHNTTSDLIEPGHILGYSEPIATMEDNPFQVYTGAALKGLAPAVPTHSNQFAVAIEAITPDDGVGLAAFMGLIYVKVNWTDEEHTKVKVADGETLLQSDTSGITPVWHEEIPDPGDLPAELWALINLGGGSGSSDSANKFGEATSDISAATGDDPVDWGSGMFEPIEWDGSHGAEIEIKNRFRGHVDSGTHFWWFYSPSGEPVLLVPDCV